MVEWAKQYVGIPYSLGDYTMEACDCYGLLYLIYKNELNIELPTYQNDYSQDSDSQTLLNLYDSNRDRWSEVKTPDIGDVVYFNVAGFAKHVGVMVSNKHFVHNLRNYSSICELRDFRWRNRIIGFYRYE